MPDSRLIEYIKQQSVNGVSKEVIEQSLLNAGWREEDIQEGFQTLSGVEIASQNNLNNSEIINQNKVQTINQSQVNTTTKQPKHSLRKILWVLIIIILLSGVSFAAYKYVYLPQKNNTPNKEFINNNPTTTKVSNATNTEINNSSNN